MHAVLKSRIFELINDYKLFIQTRILMIKKDSKSMDQLVIEKITATIKWWHEKASIKAEDPWFLILLKVAIRLVGLVIMLALSPFALLGFILAISLVL